MAKVVVTGGRNYFNKARVYRGLDYFNNKIEKITEIIAGECKSGVDQIAKDYATERGIKYRGFEADFVTHGKAGGPIRNREMAKEGSHCLAFWNSKSKGTGDMIEAATEAFLITLVIPCDYKSK